MLIEVLRGCPQIIEANAGTAARNRPRSSHSPEFSILQYISILLACSKFKRLADKTLLKKLQIIFT